MHILTYIRKCCQLVLFGGLSHCYLLFKDFATGLSSRIDYPNYFPQESFCRTKADLVGLMSGQLRHPQKTAKAHTSFAVAMQQRKKLKLTDCSFAQRNYETRQLSVSSYKQKSSH